MPLTLNFKVFKKKQSAVKILISAIVAVKRFHCVQKKVSRYSVSCLKHEKNFFFSTFSTPKRPKFNVLIFSVRDINTARKKMSNKERV